MGAFEVKTPQGTVVFIDTPGHEAFTTIRQRGAKVADIAVIVIAADDGIMPQTEEAIAHAKAAGAKLIFAINKIDLPQADPEKVKRQLMERGFVPEEYGGDAIVIPISAKTGQGVQDLLEMILLLAELEDYRADPNAEPRGVILESKLDKQAGIIANMLVQEGTFRVGDYVVAGEAYGRIRAMMDADGNQRKEAGPGSAVQVLGFQELPHAGDVVEWVPDLGPPRRSPRSARRRGRRGRRRRRPAAPGPWPSSSGPCRRRGGRSSTSSSGPTPRAPSRPSSTSWPGRAPRT